MNSPANLTAWERWELASFDAEKTKPAPARAEEPAGEDVSVVQLPTAAQIEEIHRQARDEGFSKGREEGYRAGLSASEAQVREQAQHLAQATSRLETALTNLDATVADELLLLAVEIAREVVRRELTCHPEALISVVHEALAQLPHQHAAIYLHPEDAALLRAQIGEQMAHAGHRIHEDLKLARGDCVLEAGGTQIDATVATRWRRVLESLGIADGWQRPVSQETASAGTGQTDES